MSWIAVQPYVKVHRRVVAEELVLEKEDRNIYLYEDRIVTKYRDFPIREILDLSYRELGDEGGLLYLHTVKGVFSYQVLTSPETFIRHFRSDIKGDSF